VRILNNNGYDLAGSGRAWYAINHDGLHGLVRIEPGSAEIADVALPFTYITDVRACGDDVVFAGASPVAGQTVVLARADGSWHEARPRPGNERLADEWISVPEPITFAIPGGGQGHAFLYPPVNPQSAGPAGELPPLVVNIHGGPVWAAFGYLQPEVQFFTSRGLAYLDVNYRGSVGWGRAYRRSLYGQWGIADVEDAVSAALAVIDAGRADPARVAVRGPSAGGWTTLAALAFTDFFAAGVSAYGVSDPERFVLPGGTHKYESRYNLELIAPYPEGKAEYDRRSPLKSAASIASPLLLLQGLEDTVVLPEQSRLIADAVRGNGVLCELVEFPGEGHGFRQAAHISQAYQAELAFLGRALGFTPAPSA
jgi:dipeptidyl aminopeptidase/acylaminoacyl peptidase